MKTYNLTWSFGGRNQKCVHNFSRETVGNRQVRTEFLLSKEDVPT